MPYNKEIKEESDYRQKQSIGESIIKSSEKTAFLPSDIISAYRADCRLVLYSALAPWA